MDSMDKNKQDFYLKLRGKLNAWSQSRKGSGNPWVEYLLFAPDLFHLLCKLSLDPDVPTQEKAKLGLAITYFVFPLDLVPEILLGPAGYVDDTALAAYVLHGLLNNVSKDVLIKHWAGKDNLLEVIQKTLKAANEMLSAGVWGSLKRIGGRH
ncbi:MAG: DUF1232 domain-containing protein [Gammaproteobacteria bacterium]|nr:DUF1232 domain-containing protein [Gammaproteobacteria bacterium]MDH5800171.1 DUF1232 domain-containing protein [Gammaproteobacteria bacterium]